MTRIGWWLFRWRTVIPVPLAVAVLLVPPGVPPRPTAVVALGVGLVAIGEGLRLWGVRHIGVVSRTRSDRLGPLVASGPFAFVRNPLYVGNILLWAGFALSARLLWLASLFVAILAFEYHAIVRWEEQLLEARLGASYSAYAARVPRWIPFTRRKDDGAPALSGGSAPPVANVARVFPWRETIYSERGTLIAIAAGYLLLWGKSQL